MTHDEALVWISRAPTWTVTEAHASAGEARLDWQARSVSAREQLDLSHAGGSLTRMLDDGSRIAADAALEVAIIAAMWPRAPGDVLAEMRT